MISAIFFQKKTTLYWFPIATKQEYVHNFYSNIKHTLKRHSTYTYITGIFKHFF